MIACTAASITRSNGIGIVDNSSSQPRIKYLFDISDTSPRDQSVAPPYIWQMRPDAQDTVLDGISAALAKICTQS